MTHSIPIGRSLLLIALVACAVFVVGEQTADAQGCIPGAQVACACPNGTQGVQACTTQGTFEPCRCAAVAPLPAGPPPPQGYGPPPGQRPPPRYRTERTPILGLVIAGAVTFGVVWLATVGVTAGVSSDADRGEATGYAAIPMVGPWVMLGSDLDTDDYSAALVTSGILQAAGVAMFVLGVTIRTKRKVPVYGKVAPGAELTVGPTKVGNTGVGIGALGTF